MSDSDYDLGDDDEFIALTLKPKQQSTPPPETQQPQPQQISAQSNNELLIAKGEIAVLRAKLLDLEKAKLVERDELSNANQQEKHDRESKIKALESSVKRLEDERKFLSVEVRNLNSKKKRKRFSEDFRSDDAEMADSHSPQTPVSVPQHPIQHPQPKPPSAFPTTPATASSKTPEPEPLPKQQSETIKIQPQLTKNDNVSLIDSILCQTIIGLPEPSMTYLNRLALHHDFNSAHLSIPKDESISNSITQFLLKQKDITRLDHFITSIVKEFMTLVKTLIGTNDRFQILPVPFILSIIHSILTFRPSAISNPLKRELIEFLFQIISNFQFILKQDELNYSEYYERHKRVAINVIQFKLIHEMILQFSFELIEIIVINLNYEDEEFNVSVIELIQKPLMEFTKLLLSAESSINLISSLVEILNCSIGLFEDKEVFPLINQEIINSFLGLIKDGFEWKQNWLFCGLNRVIGNNLDSKSIESLISDKISKYPNVVHPLNFKTFEEKFEVKNQHELHLINLQLEILMFFEKLILTLSNGIVFFHKDTNYLKTLIISIAKQQEDIFKVPRSNLTHLRSKLISSMIRTLDLIWGLTISGTNATSPLLPKDLTHILLVVLSRIAFSNNQTGEEAVKFLYALREKGYKLPVFNQYAEENAREISHINTLHQNNLTIGNNSADPDSEFWLRSLVHAEAGFSNGLEFAYDDDVVELSRDILEKCTTMEEADALYMAMNVN